MQTLDKELEHPWIWVSVGALEPAPQGQKLYPDFRRCDEGQPLSPTQCCPTVSRIFKVEWARVARGLEVSGSF